LGIPFRVIAGSTCAAGLGVAQSALSLHQASPSLDGSAAYLGSTPRRAEAYFGALQSFPFELMDPSVWNLERVGDQVHCISVSVADQTYSVETYWTAQSNWHQEEIEIAFQMDGNYAQQPYNVWLDEVNLLGN
jgi:hypothetical protein